MRFLITGGAGFVGSHLAECLLDRGHRVHVLDDLSTGAIENIRHLKGRPDFGYTVESASNTPVVAELVDEADCVYHLAAAVGVELIVESPVRTIETNVHCTEVVLAQANKKRKPVFLASTSEVYGKSAALPFHEDADLLLGPTSRGRWSYACSKALDEYLGLAYWKERGLPVVVGRLFNTVGPRQTGRYGMVVPTFVQQALGGQPVTVYGDGSQRRCFCHVDRCRSRAGGPHGPRGSARSRVQHREHRGDFNGRARQEGHQPRPARTQRSSLVPYDEAYEEGFEDMPRRIPDTGRIEELLGWRPTKTLDQILEDVIEDRRIQTEVDQSVVGVLD